MLEHFGFFRRVARACLLALAASLVLAGCARIEAVESDADLLFGTPSLSDRCVEIMRAAIPGVEITVTDRRTTADVNTAAIEIDATRRNVPATGAYARDIAAQCTFAGGILTGFHWGVGPVLPPDAGPAR